MNPFDGVGTLAAFDGRIEEMADGYARLRYPFDARWCNPRGTLQGGVFAVYLDDCMGYAAVGRFGPTQTFTTVHLSISYFRPVETGDVVAIGRVVRSGRRTAYLEGEILNANGELAAKGVSTVLLL